MQFIPSTWWMGFQMCSQHMFLYETPVAYMTLERFQSRVYPLVHYQIALPVKTFVTNFANVLLLIAMYKHVVAQIFPI